MTKPEPARYRTTNWKSYNEALRWRGSLLIWLGKDMVWLVAKAGRPGRGPVFFDAAIQFCLMVKVLFGLPLRQATGMVSSMARTIGPVTATSATWKVMARAWRTTRATATAHRWCTNRWLCLRRPGSTGGAPRRPYVRRHNAVNGEDNRDGHHENYSDNFGTEGSADDPAIRSARKRTTLATQFLAQGVPMPLAGDKIGNSQQGNNNAYAQENPTGGTDWAGTDFGLVVFVARLTAQRRAHQVLRQRRFLHSANASTTVCPMSSGAASTGKNRRRQTGKRRIFARFAPGFSRHCR